MFAELIHRLAGPLLGPVVRSLAIGVATGAALGALAAVLFPNATGLPALVAGVTAGVSSAAQIGRGP